MSNPTLNEILAGHLPKIKKRDGNNLDRRLITNVARDALIVSEFEKALSKTFSKGWTNPPKYRGKKNSRKSRIVNVLLSDLHFGAHLQKSECPVEYNTVQESRRLGRVATQVADYKRQYRQYSKLVINILGDVIQGNIHDPRQGDLLTYQFDSAVYYLTQFIMFVSAQYPEVEIYCTPGNHGRNPHRHPEPAVNQKFDSFETMIYLSVKAAIQAAGIANCKFIIPKTPYFTVQLFENKLFGTHGESVFRSGSVGNNINVKNLAQQVCKWNTSRSIGGPFAIFACGHIHVASITTLPDQVTMITNGALIPPDPYSISIGSPDNTCGQYMWESVEGHAVGDQRLIIVDGAEKRPMYNDIIKLYKGF
jgi:hypothetical protein